MAVFIKTIGEILQAKHYRGIFGLDLIIDASGRPYIIELNARLTGMTTPLAMLCNKDKKTSLMLMHVLEMAGVDYQLDSEIINNPDLDGGNQGGYLIVHNNTDRPIKVDRKLIPGVYQRDQQGQFVYLRAGYSYEDLQTEREFVLADVPSATHSIIPGKRILRVLTLERVLEKNSQLGGQFIKLVQQIRNHFIKQ